MVDTFPCTTWAYVGILTLPLVAAYICHVSLVFITIQPDGGHSVNCQLSLINYAEGCPLLGLTLTIVM